jgi:trehalose 6-phosphate synthase/phosphatase
MSFGRIGGQIPLVIAVGGQMPVLKIDPSGEKAREARRAQQHPVTSDRVLIVSNRLPVRIERVDGGWDSQLSAGGLATALQPALKERSSLWIGWTGAHIDQNDNDGNQILDIWKRSHGLHPVNLPPDIVNHFYEGYSNRTIWPLFHHFPSRFDFDPDGWAAYQTANRLYLQAILEAYRPGDQIWVHDYHLMLLPHLIREAIPDAPIGFFLHIPFPSSEVFRMLPGREALLEGLLGADLIGFQTHSHLQHFRSSLLRVCRRDSRSNAILVGGREVRLEVLPIGIDTPSFAGELDKEETQEQIELLRSKFANVRLVLAVDRLDYTKGIPQRLNSFRRFLRNHPEWREKVTLVQIAVPSRETIGTYEALGRETNELVGQINGEFGTAHWTPISYIRQGIPRSHLVALYHVADVCWVSPLQDGMNLVAKEYVTCKPQNDGVLILSEFAGAAEEMGEALITNPYDHEHMEQTLLAALTLENRQSKGLMRALRKKVLRNDATAWSDRFLTLLGEAATAREQSFDVPVRLDVDACTKEFEGSSRRLILLDYDGTLVEFSSRPEQAAPSARVIELLRTLSKDNSSQVVVLSGRSARDLDNWFPGLDNVWFAAEHGGQVRRGRHADWEEARTPVLPSVMDRVRTLLGHFLDRIPGSLVEEKRHSIVWHYRMCNPESSSRQAQELVAVLEGLLAGSELHAVHGNKIVEIKPTWLHKGALAQALLAEGNYDFVMAIGDDRTDEDMFEQLPRECWTVHVGSTRSRARFYLDNPSEVLTILGGLATAQGTATEATLVGDQSLLGLPPEARGRIC